MPFIRPIWEGGGNNSRNVRVHKDTRAENTNRSPPLSIVRTKTVDNELPAAVDLGNSPALRR